jgi:hypothetical protein
LIAWGRLTFIAAALCSSIVLASLLPSTVKATDMFVQIVPSVCATLAGFLLTAMVLIADKTATPASSWRLVHLLKFENGARLSRYGAVFILFVFTAFFVTGLSALDRSGTSFETVERIAFALTALCFYASLTLPSILKSIISDRFELEIKSRGSSYKSGSSH